MGKKYEFTGETRDWYGRTVHRIRAVRDFGDVKAGDLGGWIETEENLSHNGDCWVAENGMVTGHGVVTENGTVTGDGRVAGYGVVTGDGRVTGVGRVTGNGVVTGNGRVFGNGVITGNGVVTGNGRVFGNGRVVENDVVRGDAEITREDHVMSISGIGSRDDTTTFFRCKCGKIGVTCGCFSGYIDEFEAAVQKTHGDNEHGQAYRLAIELAKLRIKEA